MKYNLGDFVRFVDEKREGFITRIIDDKMIGVTGDDDFEIPVLASKVTTVHGYKQDNSNKVIISNQVQAFSGEFKTKGLYIALVNDHKTNNVVHVNIVNDTSFQIMVSLTTEKQNVFKGEFANIITPKATDKVYSGQLADLQIWPSFIIQVIFYTPQNQELPTPLVIKRKFKAKDLSGAKKQIPLLNQQGWLIQLDEPELIIDAQKLKESFFNTTDEKITVEKPANEIDLHIEKLRKDYQFINSSEIFQIQLDHFHKALDASIVHQLPEIIFIHGSGNGILRHEIHKLLGKHQKVHTFMDARKEKFGYGATKVILK